MSNTLTLPVTPHTVPFAFNGSSSSVTANVPGKWPVALDGHVFMVDTNPEVYLLRWRHESLNLLRPQADQSSSPSESSLNPDALWRRGADSWHGGAGQDYRDRDGGNPYRYRSSKGLNPWTKYQLSLLNDTDQKKSSANTNLRLAVAGSRLYVADGSGLAYTTDVTVDSPTWTAVTGYTGGSIVSLTSDGFTIYFSDGADIWTTNTGTGAATSVNTLNAGIVAYVKGRLMAAGTGATSEFIYNITTIGTPPSALNAPLDSNFTWVGFADGPGHIYCAGYSGDKSLIYRIQIKGDGTSLDAPIPAGELPDGEIIRSIYGYLGFILLGTSSGVRFCETDGQGNLVIGPIISDSDCYTFEGQDKFVWFGWDSYDATSTGLGRLSLETFTENLVTGARAPAYASDLMVTGTGSILSVVTFQNIRVFTVSGLGVYADSQALLASGVIKTGLIGFGIPDEKIGLSINTRTKPLTGSYTVAISLDEASTFTTIETESVANSITHDFPITDGTARFFELQVTLTASAGTGPTLSRWTLKASPGGTDSPAEIISAPLIMAERVILPGGEEAYMDVMSEREFIKDLRRTRSIFPYQEADTTYYVQMENFEWYPRGFTIDEQGAVATPNGIMFCQMKRLT